MGGITTEAIKLSSWLSPNDLDLDIQMVILSHLYNWRDIPGEEMYGTTTIINLAHMLQEEEQISWQRFLEGWVHQERRLQ
jgi:hypothetical protein